MTAPTKEARRLRCAESPHATESQVRWAVRVSAGEVKRNARPVGGCAQC
jgi:hypothetical protein